MKKIVLTSACLALLMGGLPGASAGPSEGGISSDNVEFVEFIPFEVGTATGANFWSEGKDDYMVLTGWRSFSIYDINDPESPELISLTPFGFKFENEDVATNGEIMLFSESLPDNVLHVWNIEDKSNPVEIAAVEGAGDHTTDCVLDCKWAYGDSGHITDLRNPAKAKLLKEKWSDGMPPHGGNHDVNEVAPGLVLTSTNPMLFLDARKDPVHPKLLAMSEQMPAFIHSNDWARNAKDNFALSTGETWVGGVDSACNDDSAGLTTWDTRGWRKTRTLKKVDTARMYNGAEGGGPTGGNPVMNGPFGCSSHWFESHPKFHNGGLVVGGWYNHGTRIHQVSSKGKIKEIGYFLPHAGGTSGAYWITDRVIYAVDYQRGLDVLKYTGKV